MILTNKTFSSIVKVLRGCYPTWNIGEDPIVYRQNWQEVVPEEMAEEMLRVYRTHRARGPESAVDFVNAYIENQLENANSAEEVIDKITIGIKNYDYSEYELPFEDCDEYIMQTVIRMLPCSEGVKAFYIRNKHMLNHLARYAPEPDDQKAIYKKLEYDYRDQLIIVERNGIIKQIGNIALPKGNNSTQLEG